MMNLQIGVQQLIPMQRQKARRLDSSEAPAELGNSSPKSF
jgi:hypothetical protein